MPISRCRVSYEDSEGVTHAVEVEAESLYEAVALAVNEFRTGEIITETPPPTTLFTVLVLRKPIEHRIALKKVHLYCAPSTKDGPSGMLKRERMRKLLSGEG